ncbi:nucleotide pyrophosphohydrolase [Virgibacillus siamensis]|uniref:nucleotide pyrophosphohydrolase n=1 Tax=Virgibacillus siamensis TaxID=480071 RepID=UPI0009854E22|nr:nucleotide pyrophosphohydrolase [Virgibacillus siamensis]
MGTNQQPYSTEEIQRRVDSYISQFKEGYFSPLSLMARLTEETGELAREINHYFGEKPKKTTEKEKTVEEELGDIIFVLTCFANSLNIDLSEAFEQSISKIEIRDKDRWTKKN